MVKPISGTWNRFELTEEDVSALRKSNLAKLSHFFAETHYDEVYVNVGKNMMKMIEGWEKSVPSDTRIIYDKGSGMGAKMANMRDWFKSNLVAQ